MHTAGEFGVVCTLQLFTVTVYCTRASPQTTVHVPKYKVGTRSTQHGAVGQLPVSLARVARERHRQDGGLSSIP